VLEAAESRVAAKKEGGAAIPLVKIVFVLAARISSMTVVRPEVVYNTVIYEIWCAGISPDIFNAVESSQANTWGSTLVFIFLFWTFTSPVTHDTAMASIFNPHLFAIL